MNINRKGKAMNTLCKDIMHHYHKRKYTPKNRGKEKLTLNSIASELTIIDQAVMRASQITVKHISELVKRWNSSDNKASTINRKLSTLSVILNNAGITLDLKQFTSRLPSKVSQKIQPILDVNDINESRLKNICILQHRFGLTKVEAVQYRPYFSYEGYLVVPRALAYNGKDRVIKISTNDENYLFSLWKEFPSGFISGAYSKSLLTSKHKDYLMHNSIDNQQYFRELHIVESYKVLLASTSHLNAMKILRNNRLSANSVGIETL